MKLFDSMQRTMGDAMHMRLLVTFVLAALVVGLCPAVALADSALTASGRTAFSTQATQPGRYTDATVETESNDEIASANNIFMNRYVYGEYSKSDDRDFFTVTVPKTGTYTLSFVGDTVGAGGTWGIYAYDYDRDRVLDRWHHASDLSRSDWDVQLAAGVAYIEVYNGEGVQLGSEYHLRLCGRNAKIVDTTETTGFTSVSSDEREDNGCIEQANNIKPSKYVYGRYSFDSDRDFYVLKVPYAGVYTLSFVGDSVGASGTWGIYAYDYNRGRVLDKWHHASDLSRSDWDVQLAAGVAYIEVYNGEGVQLGSEYHLRLTANLQAASVTGISNKTYNGKAQTQSKLTVKLAGKTLVKGTDYSVSYANNKNAGNATVTIKGKGSYVGTLSRSFVIKQANIKKATFTKIPARKFSGRSITPKVVAKFAGKKLKQNTDFYAYYRDNYYKGTARVEVYGTGNFAGTKILKFKIK